jgi:hypothetical protein
MNRNKKSRARRHAKDVGSVPNETARLSKPVRRDVVLPADHIQSPKARTAIPNVSYNVNKLAIQLTIDPTVTSIEYLTSLPILGDSVSVEMIVAERQGGRTAYDFVDERPANDLDGDGLLLLALKNHLIELVEIDREQVDQQPRLSSALRIWRHRKCTVGDIKRKAIEDALEAHGPLSIRQLGRMVGLESPFRASCSLIWQGVLAIDIWQPLDRNAFVSRAAHFIEPKTRETDRAQP